MQDEKNIYLQRDIVITVQAGVKEPIATEKELHNHPYRAGGIYLYRERMS